MILAVAVAFAEECPAPAPLAQLEGRLAAAEAAWSDLDDAAFARVMDEAAIALPCVRERVSPALAARYHRLVGLRLFAAREDARAAGAFAAARAADPGYTFPASLVPEGNAARDLYGRLPLDAGGAQVPPPKTGTLLFDGVAGDVRPAGRPSIVQVLDARDEVLATAWVGPADAMPPYDAAPMPTTRLEGGRKLGPARVALLGGAAVSVGGAGAMYALALAEKASLDNPPDSWEGSPDGHYAAQARANGLAVGSGLAMGVGVGVATVALVLPW
ncbi:MAG: hypothetical protein ACOZNI_35655 [Myxococcota bacterium]